MSSRQKGLRKKHNAALTAPDKRIVALAGNPNTGKSTIFNALTGLRQHTGNWPGKTVVRTLGTYSHLGQSFVLVDLPGTYSLLAGSPDELVARDFIYFADPDATVVVVDATCLERNLNLVLQIMEINLRVVVCLNLIDEAERKRIYIDINELSRQLGVPVVAAAARNGLGLGELKEKIYQIALRQLSTTPRRLTYDTGIEEVVSDLDRTLKAIVTCGMKRRWLALRLLEGDPAVLESLKYYCGGINH